MISGYKERFHSKWLMGCAITIILIVLLGATKGTAQQDEKKEPVGQIGRMLSQEAQIRKQAVDSMLQDRCEIVKRLISLVDPANAKKYSNETRCVSAYLLGEFRATEAVPVLSQALVNEPGPIDTLRIDRYVAPVWAALVRIGRPAVPAMIENIEASDNRILRKKSLDVLYHVLGGKRRVLELLTKLQGKTKDRSKVQRVQSAIQHTQAHFKEDEEPLY